jgi:peptidoglycan/LPS O-acetylase OafA/YrhL
VRKLDYLESLRGLAALVVVFAHYVLAFYPALYWAKPGQVHTEGSLELFLSGTPFNLLYNGDFSVTIFFVLSGFVLSYKFFQDRTAAVRLAPLVVKRYVRLLLPIAFSVSAAYLFLKGSLLFHQPASVLARSAWLAGAWQIVPGLGDMLRESLFGALFLHQSSYNNVLWTMSFEFYGSLIVFGFLFLFRNSPRRGLAYLVLILYFRRTYYLAFVLGILLCDWYSREDNFLKKAGKGALAAALAVGLFMGSVPSARPLAGTIYEFMSPVRPLLWHTLGAFLVMASVLHLPAAKAFLSWKPFVLLGRVSFSLYILHFLLIASLGCYLQVTFADYLGYHAASLLSFFISLPMILVASYYTYRYIDRSGIGLSQAVYQALLGQRPVVPAAADDRVPLVRDEKA